MIFIMQGTANRALASTSDTFRREMFFFESFVDEKKTKRKLERGSLDSEGVVFVISFKNNWGDDEWLVTDNKSHTHTRTQNTLNKFLFGFS